MGITILWGNTSIDANEDCTTPTSAFWTKLREFVTSPAAPVKDNCNSGGFVKPYWTALITGSSVVNGLRRMCILPLNLMPFTPKVTLADLFTVAWSMISQFPSHMTSTSICIPAWTPFFPLLSGAKSGLCMNIFCVLMGTSPSTSRMKCMGTASSFNVGSNVSLMQFPTATSRWAHIWLNIPERKFPEADIPSMSANEAAMEVRVEDVMLVISALEEERREVESTERRRSCALIFDLVFWDDDDCRTCHSR
mmetsp:Transcript_2822/g.7156  ORF Transcript_2822/g.7156 Transcript_2822/m.7156 type:complete len:251 (-) Transcript_2822:179-931(-)